MASVGAVLSTALTALTVLTAPTAGAQAIVFPSATAVVDVGADRMPIAGDFDGDGRGDLVWYSGRPEADGVWFGRADGNVDPAPLGAGPGYNPFAGDFDGDGIDDLFWYSSTASAPVALWFGSRARQWRVGAAPQPPVPATPAVSDLDGNGSDDVYFNNLAGDDVIFSSTAGVFRTEPAYVPSRYQAVVSGDFDGNGSGDLVLYDPDNGQAALWWGSPAGRSGGEAFVGGGFRLRAGDFNGNGADDLLWYSPGDGPDAVLYGQPGQRFLGAPVSAGGDFDPVIADVDGDGAEDVFWYQAERTEDLLWFFRPTGIALLDVSSPVTGQPITVDINGDGADDTLFFAPGSGSATWWYGGLRSAGAGAPSLNVATLVSGLSNPWDIAFTPDGTMLFTERPGRLSARLPDGTVRTLSADFGDLFVSGETGLLGLAVDPDFAANRRIYTCQGAVGPQVKVVAWQLDAGVTAATRVTDPLVGGLPSTSGRHGGCRLRFDATGALLIGTGDAAVGAHPQNLASLGGKVLRVDAASGAPAAGNPFLADPNPATRLIYSYGHRNVQGLALRADGQIFEVEHGPDRDDEVNLLQAGANYGWNPVPGYNESVPMTASGATGARWASGSPTVAPSGATFLNGSAWRGYSGALAVATLKGTALRVQFYDGAGNLVGEVLPAALNGTLGRLRAATQGPDGALYLSTDNGGGADRIVRVSPS